MTRAGIGILLWLWAGFGPALQAGDWKAGAAAASITPETAIWMAGYASRDRPSEGMAQELFARALALEDSAGARAVLVTVDLLGFSDDFVERVAGRITIRHGINRDRILFNASHTHAGPALAGVLESAYRMTPGQRADVRAYTRALEDKLVSVVDDALAKLVPAKVHLGRTQAGFAVNRRVRTARGFVIGVNRAGPVDHEVPFLTVDDERGLLRAVVFGYACHNTTSQGENYLLHGDFAGWAQQWLENRHPGAVAMFVTGTAGDANPFPRGTVELAKEHGEALAQAVHGSLTGPLTKLEGPLRTTFGHVTLEFAGAPGREELEARVKGEDVYRRQHARLLLDRLERDGRISLEYSYPIQLWRFGNDVTMVGLAGEVVVDYALRLRKEMPSENLWVLGYSNDVSCYIPSRRVLEEGGYEAVDSMIYYGQPAPFAPTVEDRIVEKVLEMARKLAASP